jgi:hypothetical protein
MACTAAAQSYKRSNTSGKEVTCNTFLVKEINEHVLFLDFHNIGFLDPMMNECGK